MLNNLDGIFHYAGNDIVSRYEFALKIADKFSFNSDNIINIVDVIFVVQHILGNNISDECEPDINQDGSIDVNDVVLLVNFVLN